MTLQEAHEKLLQKVADLDKVGQLLIQKRKDFIGVEAALIGAEQAARRTYFDTKPCKVTELRDYLKSETWMEYAAERLLHNEIRVISQQYNSLLEQINALKISIKLYQDELKNLGTQV